MEREKVNLLKGYNMLLYFGGSMVMSEPTDECVVDFWINGSLSKLPVTSSNPRFIKAASYLRDSCPDKIRCKQDLTQDYNRLLSATSTPLAPARASVYMLDPVKGAAIEKDVNDFYKRYSWKPGRINISADHLGFELLFLTRLIDRYLIMDDEPSCSEMRKEIVRFIDKYILSWIGTWNDDMIEYAQTNSYRGISNLIMACIEDVRGMMAEQN